MSRPTTGERWFEALDNIDLTSVGIDVGSTTTHLIFSRVHLKRETERLSSRFVVTEREVLWRSDVRLTPYVADDRIDADEVASFVRAAYQEAGFTTTDMDTGAVIFTGEALKQRNARALATALAEEAGEFVCVSAGHRLEATLAAYGSGSVDLAGRTGQRVLCIDIGGGTTKFALVRGEEVTTTAAIEVGGRMLSWDGEGTVRRVATALGQLGVHIDVGSRVGRERRRAVAAAAADLILCIPEGRGSAVPGGLLLTGPLPAELEEFDVVTFAGGVAEYIYGREPDEHGDLGRDIGEALRSAVAAGRLPAPAVDLGNGIRSTVIGASQSSVQVSGSTVSVADEAVLPLRNVPVLHPAADLDGPVDAEQVATAIRQALAYAPDVRTKVALSFRFGGPPAYERLLGLADGVGRSVDGHGDLEVVLVIVDRDIAASLGSLLAEEVRVRTPLLCLDTLDLRPLDYVDVGRRILPAGVFPVVIKSLLFGS